MLTPSSTLCIKSSSLKPYWHYGTIEIAFVQTRRICDQDHLASQLHDRGLERGSRVFGFMTLVNNFIDKYLRLVFLTMDPRFGNVPKVNQLIAVLAT